MLSRKSLQNFFSQIIACEFSFAVTFLPNGTHSFYIDFNKQQTNNINFVPAEDFSSGSAPASVPSEPSRIETIRAKVKSMNHPVATFFHLFWKLGALFTYLFGGIIFDNFVIAFVTCVVLLAFDFWTVKNVTGRLMVGLRWWNEIKEDGSNEWIFESLEDKSHVTSLEKAIFWGGIFGAPVLWIVFAVVSALKLNAKWFVIVIIALALGFANAFGYIKCSREAKNRLKSTATNFIAKQVVKESIRQATSNV